MHMKSGAQLGGGVLPNTRNEGCKCADDRHEARKNNRLSSVLLVEFFGFSQILTLQKPCVSFKSLHPDLGSDVIVHGIAFRMGGTECYAYMGHS